MITYNIDTPDIIFKFKEIEGGIEITGFRTSQVETNIPEKLNNRTVISIGSYAFAGKDIESMYVPDTVKNIKPYAFYNSSITSIRLPDDVNLSEGVFALSKLESIKLPSQMTQIHDLLFYGATKLESIDIPLTVKKIGRRAFMYATTIDSIDIPNQVTHIDDEAFSATKLESFIMPDSVTKLGIGVFKKCNVSS